MLASERFMIARNGNNVSVIFIRIIQNIDLKYN